MHFEGLYYRVVGSGQTAVFMHGGLGLDHTYLVSPHIPLSDSYRLVFYDHRWNGRSAPIDDGIPLSHRLLIDDAKKLIEYLGGAPVILFGHSFGGFIAIEFALEYPELLAGLVLSNTSPGPIDLDEPLARLRSRMGEAFVAEFVRLLSKPMRSDEEVRQYYRFATPGYFADPGKVSALDLLDTQFRSSAHNAAVFDLLGTYDVSSRVAHLRVPTLVVVGARDWLFTREDLRPMDSVENVTIVVCEGSGHYPFVEEPAEYLKVIRSWLSTVSGAS